MDILSITENSRSYNLHSHTQFCDGRANMEDFVRKAHEMGFTHYGFTPHSPVTIPSPCNMSQEDVPKYFEEIDRLRKIFPDMHLYAGMEIDYLNSDWGPSNPYFRNLGLDYAIGSVHFIPNQEGFLVDIDGRYDSFKKKMSEYFDNDIRYVVETFFKHSHEMVAAGGFEIIGHFDKIKHNGGLFYPQLEEEDWYRRLVDDLITDILDKKYIIEINTKAWKEHKQLFPSQKHWKRLLQEGATLIVNSDAHYPELINASRKEVFAALDYLQTKQHNNFISSLNPK